MLGFSENIKGLMAKIKLISRERFHQGIRNCIKLSTKLRIIYRIRFQFVWHKGFLLAILTYLQILNKK
jgi:hypothetical protein